MAKDKNIVKLVEKTASEIFKNLGVESEFRVEEDKENDVVKINIDAQEEAGLLIGKRGETINSLQHIISLIVRQSIGEWKRISVDIGDWREKQEEYLKNLATQAAERARTTGEPQNLYNLNPAQRRVVHMVLSEEKDLSTESQGEGVERYLVVKPANK